MPSGDDIMDDSLVDDYVNSNEITKNKNVMPQNLEAEQSLLGSILFDNKILGSKSWFPRTTNKLPVIFYYYAHKVNLQINKSYSTNYKVSNDH